MWIAILLLSSSESTCQTPGFKQVNISCMITRADMLQNTRFQGCKVINFFTGITNESNIDIGDEHNTVPA